MSAVLQENQETELNSSLILLILWRQLKKHILFTVLFYAIEAVLRLAFSILLYILFGEIVKLNENNRATTYLLAFFTSFIWFVAEVFRHNAFYEVIFLVGKVKSCLLSVVFKKVTSLSQYIVKYQDLGKIINMISNDFHIIEMKAPFSFPAIVSPFFLIGVIIILVLRLGWPGIIPILVTICLIPLQLCVGKINGQTLR